MEIAHLREEPVRIVPSQEIARLEPAAARAGDRLAVDERAGGVGRAIDAVRARGERGDVIPPGDLLGERERELLIATAAAVTGDADDRLAAGEEADRRPHTADALDLACDASGRAARLAAKALGPHARLEAEPARLACGAFERG